MIPEGTPMKRALVLALPLVLAACVGSRFAPLEGMPAAIGETVSVGAIRATPRAVFEDSRCPEGVRCVQAGRVVVSTEVSGDGWSEIVPLALGEPQTVGGATITLLSAQPRAYPDRRAPRREYRFIFAGGA